MKLIESTIKIIVAVIILTTNISNSLGGEPNQPAPDDISAYYGFGEMEIVKLNWGISNLRTADFNGDGRTDIAVVNNLKSRIELLIQKQAVSAGKSKIVVDPLDMDVNAIFDDLPSRFEKQPVAVSQKVYSFVCGDFNSDKMTDLAYYGEPRGLYVILQKDGDSGKTASLSWRTRKKIKIDDGLLTTSSLVCADINNDGRDDLILAGRRNVYLLLQNQDGRMDEPVKYSTTALTRAVTVGDINGDAINDLILITADTEKPVHVRFGLETGQLGPQMQFFIEKPWVIDLHDIDKKAGDEILAVDAGSGRVMCYKLVTETQDNDGDWPMLIYPLTSTQQSSYRDMVVADFDGDNLDDVVISDPGAAELVFYRQRPSLGLDEPVRFPAFADITSLSAAAINRAGKSKTELAVLSVKERVIGLSRFANNRFTFPEPLEITGEPTAMQLADIDEDGNVDCVYISKDANAVNTLNVLYNLSETKDRVETVFEIKNMTSNPQGLKIIDADKDGFKDVLIFVKYELPILVRQVYIRGFQSVDSSTAQAGLMKNVAFQATAIADVNGDGRQLLTSQKNFARSLTFAKSKKWTVLDQYNARSSESNISTVAAFDIYSAGQPSILLLDGQKGRLQILTKGQDKTYRFEKELEVGKWSNVDHLKIMFESLTGDETRSILLFDAEKFAIITLPDTAGVPAYFDQCFNYETTIKKGAYGNFISGDINSDGRADLIMVEYNRNHIEILTVNSHSTVVSAMIFKVFEQKSYRDRKAGKATIEPREMKLADVTSDSKDDLVTIIHDRIIIYPQD